ncbi:MAG: hypothetical protein M1530_00680, partial [Candidatus Marsarchaeota archaeon]|nr:hypothetical protein [Candidatus Marsarchaeota archaeon]
MPPAPLPRSRPAARRRASPSRLLHPPSSFAASLCRFWHGIFNGKKYSVSFYSRQARAALEEEVEDCIGRRLRLGQPVEADRLARLWELMQAYIVSQNEAIELGLRASAPKLPNDTMNSFLHLLYAGEKPNSFWRKFSRRHHLHSAPPSSFWDYFEDFQARRMDVAGWLAANARGKILDIGSGAPGANRTR